MVPQPLPALAVDAGTMAEMCASLRPLNMNQYCIAFGPDRRYFWATPNGYSAAMLPHSVIGDLTSGNIEKVVWASFGGELDSFFMVYTLRSGETTYRMGKAFPNALWRFVEVSSRWSEVRVQLGAHRSYVAWAGSVWVCRGVPSALQAALCQLSSSHECDGHYVSGTLGRGTLRNVTWHDNGSFLLQGNGCIWNFEGEFLRQGWTELWRGRGHLRRNDLANLAHVTISPHSPTGGTFAFIKDHGLGGEVCGVFRIEPCEMVIHLSPMLEPARHGRIDPATLRGMREAPQRHPSDLTNFAKARVVTPRTKGPYLEMRPKSPPALGWAYSKRAGRSHRTDEWELHLEKGARLRVLQDMGNDWYIVQNRQGKKGYAHGSSLDLREIQYRMAYTRYADEMTKSLEPGMLKFFPDLASFVNDCEEEACDPAKAENAGLRICAHDLCNILRGSGEYSLEFLKHERNRFHPDRFARFCHPDHREELKAKAQALFVLFGVLMDSEAALEHKTKPRKK